MGRNKSKLKEVSPELEVDGEKTGEEEEEVYHVEVITKARVVEYEDGTVDWEYFIKWAGYPDSASSWEPKANVRGCQRLLDSFWEHVGIDNEDYADGFQVEAKKGWIRKEKEYFKNWFEQQTVEDQEWKPEDSKEEDKLKGEISRKGKSKQLATITIDTSDDDDKPLIKLVNRQKSQVSKRERDHSADGEDRPAKLQKNHDTRDDLSSPKSKTTESLRDRSPIGLFSDPPLSPEVAKSVLPQSKTVSKPTPATQPAIIPTKRIATKGIPLHRQRQNNPQVKMLDLLSANVSGGSALATKSRIVQNSPVTTGMRPAFPARNSSLSGLSFKKIVKKPIENPAEVKQPMPEPTPTRNPTIQKSHDTDMFEPASAVNPSPHSPMREDLPQPMSEAPDIDNQNSEVDNFIASAVPKGLAAPVRPSNKDKEPQLGLIRKLKPLDMMKIPKKWKWSGELFVSGLGDKPERLCDITIQDTTDNKPDDLRFSLFFQKNDSLTLKKIHDLADLNMILPSCDVVHQLARLAPRDAKDEDALHTLSKYLSCEKKFTYSSLSFVNEVKIETDIAALMLVFPPNNHLCSLFSVPEEMREDGGLLVALVPLKLRSETYGGLQWQKLTLPAGHRTDKELLSLSDRLLKGDAAYTRALRLLYFPKWLHDFIPNREYCIWPTPVDGTKEVHRIPTKAETETQALLTILDHSKATNVGCSKDRKTYVRIIFVHVGALNTLHQLHGFCEKRCHHPEMQIVTYGTHPTVPTDRWGVRQIYVIGGIVTFTPNAIVKNPLGVQRLIEKIDEHPLFACYLLPSVIGLAMKIADDMGDNELRQFILEDLFMLIAEGKVALLDAPSMNPHPTPALDRWINWQLSLLSREPTSLSAECQTVHMEKYINLSTSDRQSAIMEEISNDMLSMQLQPAVMDDYRRFVVITHIADGKVRDLSKGDGDLPRGEAVPEPHPWLEWHTLSTFRFKDNFYKE